MPLVLDRLVSGSIKERVRGVKLIVSVRYKSAVPILMNTVSAQALPDVVRVGASHALGRLGAQEAGPLLASELKKARLSHIKQALLLALSDLGDPYYSETVRAFYLDPDARMRLYSEVALSRMGALSGPPRTAIELSYSDNWRLRSEAIRALGVMGGAQAMVRLQGLASVHALPGVREAASRALESAARKGMSDSELLEHTRLQIRSADRESQLWAITEGAPALGEVGLALLKEKAQEAGEMGLVAAFEYVARTAENSGPADADTDGEAR